MVLGRSKTTEEAMSRKYIFETIAYIVSYANIDDSDLIASKLKFIELGNH